MSYAYFDIETGPAPAAELEKVMPVFEAPKNFKDPEKIAAAIAEKRAEWYERAALSPLTGRVMACGVLTPDGVYNAAHGDEKAVIEYAFDFMEQSAQGSRYKMCGFAIFGFDLPFLIKRAWALNIKVPFGLRNGRYFSSWLIDAQETWGLGDRQPEGSLDVIARYLGVGQKNGTGADFSKLYANEATRRQALDYLHNDVQLTKAVAERIGAAP